MGRRIKEFKPLEITNPNKDWVAKELDDLLSEWQRWKEETQNLKNSPDYIPNTCTEAIKDGFDNLKKHEILREKSLVFLRNNFIGYEFIVDNWPNHPHENNTCRLRERIPGWIHRFEILKASIDYARVPDGYWKERGKKLVEKITDVTPEKAAEIAASYMKDPFG